MQPATQAEPRDDRWLSSFPDTYTMATPVMTTMTAAMTPRVNTRPSQTFSTTQTNGMISSLAICKGALRVSRHQHSTVQGLSRLVKGVLARHTRPKCGLTWLKATARHARPVHRPGCDVWGSPGRSRQDST